MDRQNLKKPEITGTDALGLAARLVIGAVLVASGTMKSASPSEEFALIISNYQLQFISPDMAMALSVFLPWIELLLGYSLILGYFTRQAAAAAGGLFACFIGALLSLKARDIQLPNCGCFGIRGFHPSPTATLCMDAVLMAAAYLAWTRGETRPSLDNWSQGGYT
ncbi:MAG: DoxX family membrane protein [Elusimicrobia bacterium]|nr:DoxX family membrane protein [Elusimicrobiota bacterium]